jgi:hypothetical protein
VTRSKLSFRACFNFRRQRLKFKIVQSLAAPLNQYPIIHLLCLPRLPGSAGCDRISLVRRQRGIAPRPRNFDTELPCSYCYEFQPDHTMRTSLTRTPPPICTFAPGPQTALIWRAVGAANDYRNTLCVTSDNPLIRGRPTSLRRCCRAAIATLESKFLDSRTESRGPRTVTNLAAIAKNFHKIFTFHRIGAGFQTAWRCYGDK